MFCIDKIVEGLYIGNEAAASKIELLKQHGITHIIIAGNQLSPHFPGEFVYKQLGIYDNCEANISIYFDECYEFIKECIKKCGRVFLHCHLGISRSSTIAIAYLMRKNSLNFETAIERVKDAHIDTQPNSGFVMQLRNYQELLIRSRNTRKTKKNPAKCNICSIF